MATELVNPGITPEKDSRTPRLLHLLLGWHILLAVAAAVGVVLTWTGAGSRLDLWLRVLLTGILIVLIFSSAVAALFIRRRQKRGRVISLVINYLSFLISLFGLMHLLGIFTGIDNLADTFGRGLPFLGGVLAGYLISAIGDRYENYPGRKRLFNRAGLLIMLVFGVLFLFAIGLIPGLLAILRALLSPVPLLFFIGVILFGLMVWAMWRDPTADEFGVTVFDNEALNGYLFLSPNLLGFLFFFAGPLLLSLFVSFTDWDAFGTRNFIGLKNYFEIFNLTIAPLQTATQPYPEVLDATIYSELTRVTLFGRHFVLGAQDKLFWLALRNTLVFCLMAVPLSVIPALLLANLLNSKLPGMKFFRAIYFLPSIAAVVGVALIWQWLYNAAVGYINYGISSFLELVNLIPGVALADPQVRWLSDTRTALLAVVIMSAWQWVGFNTVLFLAGLQNIPGELYEAATVDGAGRWAKFRNVTIPLLAPTTFFVVTTAIIQALQLFEQVYVLIPTEPPGGPNNSTLTLVLYLYIKGFQRFDQGYASAVAWVLFIVIFLVTLYQFRRQRSGSGAY